MEDKVILTSDQIRSIIQYEYKNLINYSRQIPIVRSLSYQGIPTDEMVNEGVISVFDNTFGFSTKTNLLSYIKKAIEESAYNIYRTLKSSNFVDHYTPQDEDGGVENYDAGLIGAISYEDAIATYAESSDFMKVYDIFETLRFKNTSRNNFQCLSCGNTKYCNVNKFRKCSACGFFYSVTSGTNLSGLKIGYQKFYRILTTVLNDTTLSSYKLSAKCGVTQPTANIRKRIIISASKKANSLEPDLVLKELLTPKKISKLELSGDLLTPEQVSEIRTLFLNGTPRKQLCDMYNRSIDAIGDIIRCTSYNKGAYQASVFKGNKNYPLPIIKLVTERTLSDERIEVEVSIFISLGSSVQKICSKLGIDEHKVYEIIKNSRYLSDTKRLEVVKSLIHETIKQTQYA